MKYACVSGIEIIYICTEIHRVGCVLDMAHFKYGEIRGSIGTVYYFGIAKVEGVFVIDHVLYQSGSLFIGMVWRGKQFVDVGSVSADSCFELVLRHAYV